MEEVNQTTTDDLDAIVVPQADQAPAVPVVEAGNAPQPPLKVRGGDEGGVMEGAGSEKTETMEVSPAPTESVVTPETDAEKERAHTVEPVSAPAPEPPAQSVEASPPSSVEVKEKIVERVRELNEGEKEQIFRDKLKVLSPRGVSARRAKRQANLDKILSHLRQHGYITNNEVEKLCKVRDNTAYKYLTELEQQGLLIQLGMTGRRVRYRLTTAIP